MIKEETIWALGDGRSIRPFRDPWISSLQGYRVRPRLDAAIGDNVTANDWITDGTNWDEDTIHALVHPEDVPAILNTTILIAPRPDALRWPHTRNDIISVRSVYHATHRVRPTEVNLNRSPPIDIPRLWPAI